MVTNTPDDPKQSEANIVSAKTLSGWEPKTHLVPVA
jgi:hypothetical protein